ncbi:non-hydrolyzing UDP-N-acetylglucosamine 2-epimerase [Laspinema olomoucense]|uniref:non-hydrolyzing UDP-N-acetylglucosamine 2-epimerase n=1 Tax=Laspinema olomoucense TaxID=3231600 RepID=UPI0021BB9880|nr:UDP-N-acetylglucosamine 2-epimerase (non-hydrolyzing) [Laspinema sp. D3d]MCT7974897.1 UDP-N-acetylglucosamine 2-epimerase (non-hydrolyzing) [Laspinema sp. D3d]
MKCITIVGARPQFIKAATISRVLRCTPAVTEILVHTGQHYDSYMSDVFFEELEIPQPDYHLGIGSGTHGSQTGKMLEAIEAVLIQEQPNLVLVYGDTNSTLAGALAGAKLHIPVAHVEAGLRSFNRKMPEEINRILSDHSSDLLFAPTETSVKNLLHEGIPENKVHLVGDVMYDAALYYENLADTHSQILSKLKLSPKGYILATIHRAENTDDSARLHAIFQGLMQVAQEIAVVLPLHPRTRQALKRENLFSKVSEFLLLIEPVGYLDMVMLEKNARLIATDSGGVQKEAFFYRVPCVTLREETEWVELVEMGWNCLAIPSNPTWVKTCILNCLDQTSGVHPEVSFLYGTGKAAQLTVTILIQH